ncbi:thyroglobulin-like [Physella acuta]|uniref:thyroglobulin-like n=1 Tax=Physella acuta TaxID=109671 RepID=UPI0027DB2FEF|nr:thyroglobulin-like [Physella acuta]
MQICSIVCEPGLTVVEFDNTFMCGPATNYTWTHQTVDNPTGLLPACTDKNVPLQVEPAIIATFDIDCNNKTNIEEMQNLISDQLRRNGCTKENNCFFDINSLSNCVVSKKRSLGTLTLTINLSLTTKSETETLDDDSTPEQEKEKLMNFENLLNQLVNQTDDGLILFLGGSFPSGNIESLQTSVLCQEGAGYYNGFCVDCQAGSYSNGNGSCVLCDKGFFQDQPRMTYCKQCPVGSTTSNKGSFSSDHCTMEPVTFEDVYPCYVPNSDQSKHNDITINVGEDHIALISGLSAAVVVVVVILIAAIVLRFRKRQNKSVETVTVFNKDQPKKM